MTLWRRFRGSVIAVLVFGGLLWAVGGGSDAPSDLEGDAPPRIFRFEKEDFVGVRIERPDRAIVLRRDGDGSWSFADEDWRPSRSMVRRVAHQLHDLAARAEVVKNPESPERYGLGEDAIRVAVDLRDGSTISFEVGDPNPTSVSWYMRPLPDGPVFVVKKAALDYYRAPVSAFREDKFAFFDASDAVAVEAEVDGRRLAVERTGPRSWRMTEPVEQGASREQVRMMLGRVAALKALEFVVDHPTKVEHLGLEPPQHRIAVRLASGQSISIRLGHRIDGGESPQRYVFLEEDDAVYVARDGLLEAFREPIEDYRDPILVGRSAWELTAMSVTLDGEVVRIRRTADDWRWPDGSVVQGSTDKRLAERAVSLEAVGFVDPSGEQSELSAPRAMLELTFDGGERLRIALGRRWEESQSDGSLGARLLASVDDGVPHVVDDALLTVIEDLHREYERKQARDAEKNL